MHNVLECISLEGGVQVRTDGWANSASQHSSGYSRDEVSVINTADSNCKRNTDGEEDCHSAPGWASCSWEDRAQDECQSRQFSIIKRAGQALNLGCQYHTFMIRAPWSHGYSSLPDWEAWKATPILPQRITCSEIVHSLNPCKTSSYGVWRHIITALSGTAAKPGTDWVMSKPYGIDSIRSHHSSLNAYK